MNGHPWLEITKSGTVEGGVAGEEGPVADKDLVGIGERKEGELHGILFVDGDDDGGNVGAALPEGAGF